jgi:putative ABC transport system permease protein
VGHLLLTWRLVTRDLRRHPGEAVLFLLAVTTATAALTLGLAATDAVTTAYLKTRAATAGPDIVAITTAEDPSRVAGMLADTPGVAAQADPVFSFSATVRAHGRSERSAIEGREREPSAVDRPLVTSGTWVHSGGMVVERSFARELDVRVGDRVTLGGRDYPVVGIAVSAATGVYPWSDWAQGPGPSDGGGRVWLTAADTRAAAGDTPGVWTIRLRLTDPAATTAWRLEAFAKDRRGADWVNTHDWRTILEADSKITRFAAPTLVVGGWLLAGAATVTLAALATVRATRDNRRAALLKAVGAGPGTVAAVLLAQHLLLTLLATALGLVFGSLVAPELVDPGAGLLDATGPPATDTVVAAVFVAVVVALAGTLGPVLRAARTSTSTSRALLDPAHLLTYHPRLTALTAYLPTPLLIGVRLLVRRPGRAVLTSVGTAATSVMVTALLTFHAVPAAAISEVTTDRDALTRRVLLGVTVAMVALSTLNTVILGRRGAVQARHTLTVSRTLGATPGQVVAALCTAQFLSAVPGVVVGVPAGLGLYWLVSLNMWMPPAAWLLTAAAAVLAAVAALTALPAWLHTRGPAARALGAEPV